jgi:hypothetical protein
VVAKVEFHFGELFPRVEFIVTNLEADSRGGAVLQQAGHRRAVDQGKALAISEGSARFKRLRTIANRLPETQVLE